MGKPIKRGRLHTASRFVAPRVSLDAIVAASRDVESAVPDDVIERFRGADVALIGPGEQGLAEDDLARVGVIARMGFAGPSSVPQRTTSRCDIGFYSGNQVARLRGDAGPGRWSAQLPPVMVFRREVASESLAELPDGVRAVSLDEQPVRTIFKGILPNFGPETIVYLLALRPERLTITHVDLFTTARYPAGYASRNSVTVDERNHVRERAAVRRSLSWHNPFTHFSFYQALGRSRSIVFSDQLAAIVAGGPKAYSERLRALYFDR